MRLLIFVLTLCCSAWAIASTAVSGTIQRNGDVFLLRLENLGSVYQIDSSSPEVIESLTKLSTGDTLSGTGTIPYKSNKIILETIDYVGLRRMLGKWISNDGLLQVKNFSEMKFYPHTVPGASTNQTRIGLSEVPTTYQYSVTPAEGKAWVMFLSDSNKTVFATIQIHGANATLKTFDPETGAMTRTLRLTKWSN
jgi:hypothetical protein